MDNKQGIHRCSRTDRRFTIDRWVEAVVWVVFGGGSVVGLINKC